MLFTMTNNSPKNLYALILNGGKSQRMGVDKGTLNYHGKSQVEHLFDILSALKLTTFLSVKKNIGLDFTNNIIPDSIDIPGPLNGILSAMKAYPKISWLVIPCDLPMISESTVERLVKARYPAKLATTYVSSITNLPEPLFAIWEKKAYYSLIDNPAINNSPQKFLIQNQNLIKKVFPEKESELYNVNTQEDYRKAKFLLKKMHKTG